MVANWGWGVLFSSAAIYLFFLGVFVGMLFERSRFDSQRAALLTRYEDAVNRLKSYPIQLEGASATDQQEPGRNGTESKPNPMVIALNSAAHNQGEGVVE